MTHWLYPANTKFYDLSGAMAQPETFWPMRSQTAVGDRVFIYLAAPHKQIGYACDVIETGIEEVSVRDHVRPFLKGEPDPEKSSTAFMKLRPEQRIALESDSALGLQLLRQHGLKGMLMGPRRLENNPPLLDYITGSLP
jgi:hypothetical protein